MMIHPPDAIAEREKTLRNPATENGKTAKTLVLRQVPDTAPNLPHAKRDLGDQSRPIVDSVVSRQSGLPKASDGCTPSGSVSVSSGNELVSNAVYTSTIGRLYERAMLSQIAIRARW